MLSSKWQPATPDYHYHYQGNTEMNDEIDYAPPEGEENTTLCPHCEEAMPAHAEDREHMEDVCDSCAEATVVLVCGSRIAEEDSVYIDSIDAYVHIDDSTSCDNCGDICLAEDTHDAINAYGHSETVCEGCRIDHYVYPEDDSYQLYHIDALYWSERHDAYFTEQQSETEGICCYSTNVLEAIDYLAYVGESGFSRSFGHRLVMGVELEVDRRDSYSPSDIYDGLAETTDLHSYAICKEDATCNGLELVTLPADLEAHKNQIPWGLWCKSLQRTAKGFWAGDAGIHIHINRAAVSPLTLGKMLVFMNSLKALDFLEVVAQRNIDGNGWCDIKPRQFDKVGKAAMHPSGGKYSTLNVTRNTIECRIFRSNTQPERIYKNLEFCHALCLWAAQESAKGLTVLSFRRYIAENSTLYPNLDAFLAERWDNRTASNAGEYEQCA